MDKREKLTMMDKIIRELEDVTNSQTSVLKKIGQLEAENINLSDKSLENGLPEIYEHADGALTQATALHAEFTEARNKFVKDNKLDEVAETEA
ncbi:MAG: hypothetical protein WKF70_06965 [Chitinophagaceae bacterium]